MTLTNSINLPGLAHYRPSNSPDGTCVFNRKDGHTYVTQRGLWICVTGDQEVMPATPKKSRLISAGGQWVPAQQNPPKRSLLGRIWAWLKKLFSK